MTMLFGAELTQGRTGIGAASTCFPIYSMYIATIVHPLTKNQQD